MTTNPVTLICHDEEEEAAQLTAFFHMLRVQDLATRIWTFNGLRFDLPLLTQRARYLQVAHPGWDIRKYSTSTLIDLWDKLTFGGNGGAPVMSTTLGSFCRAFGIAHDETVSGRDTARLIADGQYEAVAAHCADDVAATVALARRIGYRGPAVAVDVETVPRDGFTGLLPEPNAPGNLKDPAKIAAALDEKRQEQRDKAGLDINLSRIVVLGYQVVPVEYAHVTMSE